MQQSECQNFTQALVKRFKIAYPRWDKLSWQKSSQIQRDIRSLRAFTYLVQFLQKQTESTYSFKKDLVVIFEKIYEKKLQQYVAEGKYDKVSEVFIPQGSQQQFKKEVWKELRVILTGEVQEQIFEQQHIENERETTSLSDKVISFAIQAVMTAGPLIILCLAFKQR